MECSIKEQKVEAMKKYNRAQFVYNLVLYSLTSMITCFFFSYPFWFPSLDIYHLLSSIPTDVSFFLNPKCFFILGNLIVLILVGESKLKQSSSSSSSSSDFYDEYVSRSRSGHHNVSLKKVHVKEEKKEVKVCKSGLGHEEKKKGMRKSKSEVWGESGMHVKSMGKKEEFHKSSSMSNDEQKKMGMRSCKSEIWSESEIVRREKPKGKGERETHKSSMNHEEEKMGMRSCKSEIWDHGGDIVMREKTLGKVEEEIIHSGVNEYEEKKMGMRSCKSEIWDHGGDLVMREKPKGKDEEECIHKSSIIHEEKKMGMIWDGNGVKKRDKSKGQREEEIKHEEKKMGMRSCKSEIWDNNGSEINGQLRKELKIMSNEENGGGLRSSKSAVWGEGGIMKKTRDQPAKEEDLNKRVEAFIARVNNQRLLEAKLVDHA